MPAHSRTLILIDGFAGSGKSTLAQALWLQLARGGRKAVWFHEHELGHPIFPYREVEELLAWTPDSFEERMLAGWEAFVSTADAPGVHIVEGSFFQLPVGVMLSMNVPAARIRKLLRSIDALLVGQNACLIHLANPDERTALREIEAIRGARWIEGMTTAVAQSEYGRRHRVRDVRGLAKFYERQRAIIDAAVPRLSVRRVTVDLGPDRWARSWSKLAKFAGVKPVPPAAMSTADLLRYVGEYRSPSGRRCVVTTDNESLYVQLPVSPLAALVRVTDAHFCLKSLPIDVRFTCDRRGRVRRFDYESRMTNEVLSETSWVRA
jgi:hypothetical protein